EDGFFATFAANADPEVLAAYQALQQDASFPAVSEFEKTAFAGPQNGTFGVDPSVWFSTMTHKMELLKQVEDLQGNRIVAQVDQLRADASSSARTALLLTVSLVTTVLLLLIFVVRSIIRPLRELTHAAGAVARGDVDAEVAY